MEPVRQDGRALALRFQARFLAARPLGSLPWADLEQKLKNSDSLFLLDILQKTILHPLSMKYPPSVKYRRCFLAELIKKHESTAAEPLDELYEALADTLFKEESTHCYKSYLLPTGESITLSETVAIISQGTTGLVTWDAALYLAEWAIENSTVLNNRTVLELGSGIGLTGIVISKACNPKAYIFSDYHQCVLEQLKENIYLNGFVLESEDMNCTKMQSRDQTAKRVGFQGPKVAVAELDWESVTQEQLWELHPDVVIAADVVYDPEVTLSLIGVLQKLSASKANGKNPEIYIAFTIRNPDTYHLFQTELGKVGIGWHVIPTEKKNLFPYDTHSDITILQLLL
ncbi:protein-lysine N-methyltransferase EEF2KMT isoform X1 [Alligator mississippiensis]|uniref:protein-lysine N-methyltransferase EEF2KMT isoform X1 n=1 Tax=Alligator mississippiensis TaxID=8496 RepID=UPI00287730A7|nr:protein-lysine N-methyltransferase EEF2KMT isoform X1 [Alligator mississippiensis]